MAFLWEDNVKFYLTKLLKLVPINILIFFLKRLEGRLPPSQYIALSMFIPLDVSVNFNRIFEFHNVVKMPTSTTRKKIEGKKTFYL